LEETADVFAAAAAAGVDDAAAAGVKRPLDIDSLQRKKFKTDELPLTAAQHAAIEH
ncbi:hypothetical protein BP00DRAFT_421929, partial [Aspergillus indologenus CBS 114.80]